MTSTRIESVHFVRWGLLTDGGMLLAGPKGEPRIFHARADARVEKDWRVRMGMVGNLRVVKIHIDSTYTVIE